MIEPERYDQLIDWLFHQFPAYQKIGEKAYKPSLENTWKLIEYFRIDLTPCKFVHVAGTNGKGTTCSLIASIFTEAGYKTGLFTSPHIHDFRERIRINGEMISEEKILEFIEQVKKVDWNIKPSFFEITWVLALKYFTDSGCDMIVVETGLGGRLDATNIITPEVSVITNIGLDHINILGDTRSLIAAEKAGIIKQNVPVLIGESDDEIHDVFLGKADALNAQVTFVKSNTELTVFNKNRKLALSVISSLKEKGWGISQTHIDRGIKNLHKNTGLKGRFQILKTAPLIIADAAHNKEGIASLITFIRKEYATRRVFALYGASNDKSLEQIFQIFPENWNYYLTRFKNQRSCSTEVLDKVAKDFSLNYQIFNSSRNAYTSAQNTMNKEDILIVFGSFFLLEEII